MKPRLALSYHAAVARKWPKSTQISTSNCIQANYLLLVPEMSSFGPVHRHIQPPIDSINIVLLIFQAVIRPLLQQQELDQCDYVLVHVKGRKAATAFTHFNNYRRGNILFYLQRHENPLSSPNILDVTGFCPTMSTWYRLHRVFIRSSGVRTCQECCIDVWPGPAPFPPF
jgi:hypothetical protein